MARRKRRGRRLGRATAAALAAGAVLAPGAMARDAGFDPNVIDMSTGTFKGELWLQARFQQPFPKPAEQSSAGAAFSVFTPDGVHLSGSTQVHGGQASTRGSCAPDSTACPAGGVDVEAKFTNGRKTVTFFLGDPSDIDLDPKAMTFRGQFASQESPGAPVTMANFPADGQPVPFTDKERNPVKKKATQKKGPEKKKAAAKKKATKS